MPETIAGLPRKVTATLADDGPDGRVYRLADDRGYTKAHDTIRVSRNRATYTVEAWRREGWIPLLTGKITARMGPVGPIEWDDLSGPYAEAISRAVAVLYGMEDHG